MAESNLNSDIESQKRRSTRIVQAVPLTVTGVDALGRPFQERTSTLIINCHGCRYQSKHYVLKNMWVTFEVPHNEPGHEARKVRGRVTWIQRPRTVRELFQIGIELEVSGNVWGIAFPPGDWFPFPEEKSGLEIASPNERGQADPRDQDWSTDTVAVQPEPEAPTPAPTIQQHIQQPEDNVRVLPLPAGNDASAHLARQVARLIAEAKQQVQATVRETATRAVASETRPLLAALQTQLKDAAEKSVETAISAHLERTQREAQSRIQDERDNSVTAMREEWSRELDRRISEARQQIDSQLTEVETTRRANFEQQIQNQLLVAIEKLQSLSGNLGANAGEVRAQIEQLRQNSAEAAEHESTRWQQMIDQRATDAQARLAQLEESVKHVTERISRATSDAESGWRGRFETDLAAAGMRWNQKMESSIEEAARRAAERLSGKSEEFSRQQENQLQQRISLIGSSFSQVTADAENALNALRAAISNEIGKGQSTVSQLQQSVDQLESRRNEFSSLLNTVSDEWTQRSTAMLEAQTGEMNRRAESAAAGMADRLQPMLEAAGQETIQRLANELEQQLAPQLAKATEIMGRLAFDREQAEKALSEHQHRIWQVSEQSVQDSVSRSKELLAQVEKEFGESTRAASTKWFAELDSKATETTHTTFEALYKSADWYEKKIQTQMQASLEKGLDQATSNLREKAGELSGLFASELDHYSRSYVEHAQTQMQESGRDIAEKASLHISQAGDDASSKFGERAAQSGREQFEQFQAKTNSFIEQSTAQMETNTSQLRSKLEEDARTFASDFQRVLAKHSEQSLTQGKQELASQVDLAKQSLQSEAEALDIQFRTSLQTLGSNAIDEHKLRLENASNLWLLTTVTKLNQQSDALIDQLAATTEKRLQSVCGNVFAEMGESLRQRLASFSAPLPVAVKSTPVPSVDYASPTDSERK